MLITYTPYNLYMYVYVCACVCIYKRILLLETTPTYTNGLDLPAIQMGKLWFLGSRLRGWAEPTAGQKACCVRRNWPAPP